MNILEVIGNYLLLLLLFNIDLLINSFWFPLLSCGQPLRDTFCTALPVADPRAQPAPLPECSYCGKFLHK